MNNKDNIDKWNQIYASGRQFTPVAEALLDSLELSGGRSLDIGCGTGELCAQLNKRGFEVTGIDLSDYATKKAKALNPNGNFMAGDFLEQVFEPSIKFDIIFINKVLAFVTDKPAFISKARGLLASGGQIVIITPVLYTEHQGQYNERLKSISVDHTELMKLLPELGKPIATREFEDYGKEEVYVIR